MKLLNSCSIPFLLYCVFLNFGCRQRSHIEESKVQSTYKFKDFKEIREIFKSKAQPIKFGQTVIKDRSIWKCNAYSSQSFYPDSSTFQFLQKSNTFTITEVSAIGDEYDRDYIYKFKGASNQELVAETRWLKTFETIRSYSTSGGPVSLIFEIVETRPAQKSPDPETTPISALVSDQTQVNFYLTCDKEN